MKKRRLEIRIRSTRKGVPAEEIVIHNTFSEAEARRRWREIVPKLMEITEKNMGWPNCGACPGDGSVCRYECRLAAESPECAEEEEHG